MPAPSILADVNVWLATLVESHPHHAAARRWWREDVLADGRRPVFCRVTQLGLLRLLTNEQVMGPNRRSLAAAWRDYLELALLGPARR